MNKELNKEINKMVEENKVIEIVKNYIANENPSEYELEKHINNVIDLHAKELTVNGKTFSVPRVKDTMKDIVFASVYKDFVRMNIPSNFEITDEGINLIYRKSYNDYHSEGYVAVYSDMLELLELLYAVELTKKTA